MKQVVIYTGEGCTHCHSAKDYFKQKGIDFIEFNITEDPAAGKFLRSKKVMSIPYIIIGDVEMIGFDEKKVLTALGL